MSAKKMNIYLDLCAYNRPFDDQTQPRILLETMGFLVIMSIVQTQKIQTFNSFVLEYENTRNPKLENRQIIADILSEASLYIHYDSAIAQKALEIEQNGIKHFDALHLACADCARADFFVSCDDDLVKKANTIKGLNVNVISLLNFIAREVF